MKNTRSAAAAIAWLRRPAWSRNSRARALSGTMPSPVSLLTSTTDALALASAWHSPRRRLVDIQSGCHQIAEPEGEAIDQHCVDAGLGERRGDVEGRFDRLPTGAAAILVLEDARGAFPRRPPAPSPDRGAGPRTRSAAIRRTGFCPNAHRPAPERPARLIEARSGRKRCHGLSSLRGSLCRCVDRAGFLATGHRSLPPSRPGGPVTCRPIGAGRDLTVHSCGGSAGLAHRAAPASLHSIGRKLADGPAFGQSLMAWATPGD